MNAWKIFRQWFQQPEYTGENRCAICTIVNLIIAGGLSGALGLVSPPAAVLSFFACATIIYFRGYLVPGTPTLTKRYFPDRVLRLFGKADSSLTLEMDAYEKFDAEPEHLLREAGIVESNADGSDICLDHIFRQAWREEMRDIRTKYDQPELLSMLLHCITSEIPIEDLNIEESDNDRVNLRVMLDDVLVGKWESEAALIAELAAANVLQNSFKTWTSLRIHQQSRLLASLRPFLEKCPICDGNICISQETVESCCTSAEIIELACVECNARIFEIEDTGIYHASE